MVSIHSPKQQIKIIAVLSLIIAILLSSCIHSSAQSNPMIFLGDSRTVGMYMTVHSGGYKDEIATTVGNESWYAKCSQGYSYLVHTAVPRMESHGIPNGAKILVLMGVNDCSDSSANQYASYLNRKAKEWAKQGASTYFVSVNPVYNGKSRWVKNSQIESFNRTIQQALSPSVHYLNTFSMLRDTITSTSSATDREGLHYQAPTYWNIYRACQDVKAPSHPVSTTHSQLSSTTLKPSSTTSSLASSHPCPSSSTSSSPAQPRHTKLGLSTGVVIGLCMLGIAGILLI